MQWNELSNLNQLTTLEQESTEKTVLIFKHSTSCSISRVALDRLQRNWKEEEMKEVKPYFLDLISYRDISNQIAERFSVYHESPQVILLRNNKVIYADSHWGIDYQAIKQEANKISGN
ncbi:MAG: bacillithiol system redox-active protein YtxJ [Cyclobacteriaceae bacterium]|jgi:bacillithiol system protein YtxJ|nr:bacillithiol system redox-active protein YtxJ [Cyclobacteriaceae bacterium]